MTRHEALGRAADVLALAEQSPATAEDRHALVNVASAWMALADALKVHGTIRADAQSTSED